MRRMPKTTAVLACLFIAGGCFPYMYPELHHTQRLRLDDPEGDAHAFRVDMAEMPKEARNVTIERLCEIPVSSKEVVGSQTRSSITFGVFMLPTLRFVNEGGETITVRVYRPGYELLECKSWEKMDDVVWTPAPTIQQQESVLDKLFPQNGAGGIASRSPASRQLVPGSSSKAHRDALLFGASEFQRLAAKANIEEQRERLNRKGNWLWEHAQK